MVRTAAFLLGVSLLISASTAQDPKKESADRALVLAKQFLKSKGVVLGAMTREMGAFIPDKSHDLGGFERVGNLQMRVSGAKLDIVELFDGFRRSESVAPLLSVRLSIENVSETKLERASTWADSDVTLVDDVGNEYVPVRFKSGAVPTGQIKGNEPVYPGKKIVDVLVFERPVEAAKKLTLKLPASNVGGNGSLKFEFPTSSIEPDAVTAVAISEARAAVLLAAMTDGILTRLGKGTELSGDAQKKWKRVAEDPTVELTTKGGSLRVRILWSDAKMQQQGDDFVLVGKKTKATATLEPRAKGLKLISIETPAGILKSPTESPKHEACSWWTRIETSTLPPKK